MPLSPEFRAAGDILAGRRRLTNAPLAANLLEQAKAKMESACGKRSKSEPGGWKPADGAQDDASGVRAQRPMAEDAPVPP